MSPDLSPATTSSACPLNSRHGNISERNPHVSLLNGSTLPSLKRASPSLNIYFFIIIRGVLHRGQRDFMWSESWQWSKGRPSSRKVPQSFLLRCSQRFQPSEKITLIQRGADVFFFFFLLPPRLMFGLHRAA